MLSVIVRKDKQNVGTAANCSLSGIWKQAEQAEANEGDAGGRVTYSE
jgi:hypothetical protein